LRTESAPRSPSERFENPELANAHRCVPRSSLAVDLPLEDFPCVLAPHGFGAPTLRFEPLRGLQTQGTARLTGQ
jgi:hypothetical protein